MNLDTGMRLCSQRAITSARTLPLPKADMVDIANVTVATLEAPDAQPTISLRWPEPTAPNGLIVTYEIEAKQPDSPRVCFWTIGQFLCLSPLYSCCFTGRMC